MKSTRYGWIGKTLIAVGFSAAVILAMAWLAGAFQAKVHAADVHAAAPERPVGNRRLVEARLISVPVIESAVGTVRAVHETAIASKLLAKVNEVHVQAGQHVKLDDVLVRLDQEDLEARLRQAAAAVEAADAKQRQAKIEYDRVHGLFQRNNAAQIELERAQTDLDAANAEVERATQARQEAETILQYATIRSPIDGVVIDKQVEAGDMVTPGQVLLTLYDPTRMQLVASVRESLTHRLKVGQTLGVQVEALTGTCEGRVSEIVPQAQSASRSFLVKVTGPCPPGVYSGMFGRLLIPLDDEQRLVVPSAAVRRVGQLDLVDVERDGLLERRVVQLGRTYGGDVEVLSGLVAGERVALSSGGSPTTQPSD